MPRKAKAGSTTTVAPDNRVPFLHDMTVALLKPEQPQEFVIDKWAPAGWVTILSADAGLGKTTVLIHAGVCIAAGRPFYGATVRQGATLAMLTESTEAQYASHCAGLLPRSGSRPDGRGEEPAV